MENKSYFNGFFLQRNIINEIIEIGNALNQSPLLYCLDRSDRECVLHEKIAKAEYVHFLKSRPNDPRFKEVNKLFCSNEESTLIITYIGYLEELEGFKKRD